MVDLEKQVMKESQKCFSELLENNLPEIMKRSREFTSDDENFSVNFKLDFKNNGKIIVIGSSLTIPGQKKKDFLSDKVIDPSQPKLKGIE